MSHIPIALCSGMCQCTTASLVGGIKGAVCLSGVRESVLSETFQCARAHAEMNARSDLENACHWSWKSTTATMTALICHVVTDAGHFLALASAASLTSEPHRHAQTRTDTHGPLTEHWFVSAATCWTHNHQRCWTSLPAYSFWCCLEPRGNTLHRSSAHYSANSLVQIFIHILSFGQLKFFSRPDLQDFAISEREQARERILYIRILQKTCSVKAQGRN